MANSGRRHARRQADPAGLPSTTITPRLPRGSRLLVLGMTVGLLVLAGCGSAVDPDVRPTPSSSSTVPTTSPSSTDTELLSACPSVTAGPVPTCTNLFTDGEALRLPASSVGGRQFGAFVRGGSGFVTADGLTHPVSDDVAATIGTSTDYATTVYAATLSGDTVTALAPALRVDPDAIMRAVFAGRVMVGTISAADQPVTAPPSYGEPSLPVVISWSATSAAGVLSGTIANATRGASVGGTCSALNSTRGNPLVGSFTAQVGIQRVPSMHTAGDDELVLSWGPDSSGMGSSFYPSVATLMGADPLGQQWQVTQHGTPTSGPALDLTLAPIGAAVSEC